MNTTSNAHPAPWARCFALGAAILILSAISHDTGASTTLRMNVEDLSRMSDAIVIGRVESKRTEWKDRRIQTTYTIAVNQTLKGRMEDRFEMVMFGGSIKEPFPLTQRAGDTPTLFQGEQALLFLDLTRRSPEWREKVEANRQLRMEGARAAGRPVTAAAEPATDSLVMTTPMIVGNWQGRYTIFLDEDGREKAMRISSEAGGFDANEKAIRAWLRVTGNAPAAQDPNAPLTAEEALIYVAPPALRKQATDLQELKDEIRGYVEKQKVDGLKRAPRDGEARIAPSFDPFEVDEAQDK